MSELIKGLVLRLARLPADPHIPDGSPGSTQVFRAGRNFFRWNIAIWLTVHAAIFLSAVVVIAAVETAMFRLPSWAQTGIHLAESMVLLALAVSWVFTWFQLKLNYELRWYIEPVPRRDSPMSTGLRAAETAGHSRPYRL